MNDLPKRERMRFFTGLRTTADDWTAEQDYHREALRLCTQRLHNAPGVLDSQTEALSVKAAGDLKVRVLPGAAIDKDGNMLLLTKTETLTIDKSKLEFDSDELAMLYVTIQYREIQTAFIEDVEQPQYSNYSRLVERPRVNVSPHEPDNASQLELARIKLRKEATEVTDATDPEHPSEDEIDRRYVKKSVTTALLQQQLEDHDDRLRATEELSITHGQRLAAQEAITVDLATRLSTEEEKSRSYSEQLKQLMTYSRLHSRGLHTPGIIQDEPDGMAVSALGGFDLRVRKGAALDGIGNPILLSEPRTLTVPIEGYELPILVFVVVSHEEGVRITTMHPDNWRWVELARIDLQPGVTEIRNPSDPAMPGANEIDRRHTLSAGAVGIIEKQVDPETLRDLAQVMSRTRRDFVALDERFPTPSVGDVRHASLTVETIARIGQLRPGQLPELMATLAAIEQDVAQEVDRKYGNIVNALDEYHAYVTALQQLNNALYQGVERDIITAQDAVAETARELSEIGVESPIADAGRDKELFTVEDEATIVLDGGRSRARGDREIVAYRWDVIE